MKLLVIGLDGATWTLLKPWTQQGYLPTIKTLMDNGVYGNLQSTMPPSSPPAWASFMTGMNPGKHGIYDFVGCNGPTVKLKNRCDVHAPSLWKLLRAPCIVVNVPMTYPPEPVKGCIVTGLMTPPDKCYTYPSFVYPALQKLGYMPGAAVPRPYSPRNILNHLLVTARKRLRSTLLLMRVVPWRFLMVVFSGTDAIQHHLWQHNKQTILKFYRQIDKHIKTLIDAAGPDVNVILMSDHGFGAERRFFHVNQWLHQHGWLHFKGEPEGGEYITKQDPRFNKSRLQRVLCKLGFTKERIYIRASKLHLLGLLRHIYRRVPVHLSTTQQSIDWARTKAYCHSTIGPAPAIIINLEGRQPQGIVSAEEYAELRGDIMDHLLWVRDQVTGQRIVSRVFTREQLYTGSYLFEAPDIQFITQNCEYAATDRIYGDRLVSEPVHTGRGGHRLNGVFIACGPAFNNGGAVEAASIMDLAPTILSLYGVPVPEDMDGKVLTRVLKPEITA